MLILFQSGPHSAVTVPSVILTDDEVMSQERQGRLGSFSVIQPYVLPVQLSSRLGRCPCVPKVNPLQGCVRVLAASLITKDR